MRIIAGRHRGVRLAALGKGDTGAHLRPTPDRVRESLFSVLTSWVDWDSCQVLDLFAGTGALGLEALSRGAQHITFVENGRTGQRLIAENVDKLRATEQTTVLRQDATRLGAAQVVVDLVFMDPPYGKELGATALVRARDGGWLAEDALVVWEENTPQAAPSGFVVVDQRGYGETQITLMQQG